MSGGGSSKKKTTKSKDEPVAPVTPTPTQPAFFGDNQNLIAQQLAAGGYGSVPDLMAMLTQMHSPMQFTPPSGSGNSSGSSSTGSGGDDISLEDRRRRMIQSFFNNELNRGP